MSYHFNNPPFVAEASDTYRQTKFTPINGFGPGIFFLAENNQRTVHDTLTAQIVPGPYLQPPQYAPNCFQAPVENKCLEALLLQERQRQNPYVLRLTQNAATATDDLARSFGLPDFHSVCATQTRGAFKSDECPRCKTMEFILKENIRCCRESLNSEKCSQTESNGENAAAAAAAAAANESTERVSNFRKLFCKRGKSACKKSRKCDGNVCQANDRADCMEWDGDDGEAKPKKCANPNQCKACEKGKWATCRAVAGCVEACDEIDDGTDEEDDSQCHDGSETDADVENGQRSSGIPLHPNGTLPSPDESFVSAKETFSDSDVKASKSLRFNIDDLADDKTL